MLQEFQHYMQTYQMVDADLPTLIAVSGGVDSVVLCHLFKKSGLPFAIAHCNFKLRGFESDEDERFVTALSEQLDVQCYKIAFDTKNISAKEKSSIQLVARKLRYDWFRKLMSKNAFHRLATAHHINDRIETFLYNFTKGTGIRGLRSIEAKTENIIRPLLFAPKKDILAYAVNNKITYREDASNSSTKYNRNKLRIEVIPVLQSINPALEQTAIAIFHNLEETEKLYLWAIQQHRKEVLKEKDGNTHIDLQKIKSSIAPQTLLYELLVPFGFNIDQVKNILDSNTRQSGAQFFTEAYRLIINRNELIVTNKEIKREEAISIFSTDKAIKTPHYTITITHTTTLPDHFSASPNMAWLDKDLLQFPLTLRHWKEGDSFCPIGMKGQSQKLKKFFTNQKASLLNKENTKVLLSGGQICWVVGWRVDDRFKINEDTKHGVCFTMCE